MTRIERSRRAFGLFSVLRFSRLRSMMNYLQRAGAHRYISSKILVFVVLVTGLMAGALVEVECPTCRGSGTVSSTGHGDDLRVVEARFIDTYSACPYEMSLIVSISVSNDASNAVKAFLLVRVFDSKSGVLLGEGLQQVDVNAKETKTITVYVKALVARPIPDVPVVSASTWNPEATMSPCPTCSAKGKVILVKWLMVLLGWRPHMHLKLVRLLH